MRPKSLQISRKCVLFVCLLSFTARAADDAPRVVRLENGHYDFNAPAFQKVDKELNRLQAVERQHEAESWWKPVLISLGVGLAVGVATGVIVTTVIKK